MTGVSYLIPFVAAGGLLIALGFALNTIAKGDEGYLVTDQADAFRLAVAFAGGCSAGFASGPATYRGAPTATRTACGSAKSCCSRHRWIVSKRSLFVFWSSFQS